MDDLWKRIFNAHTYGDVLITMGTGKMTNRAEREIGLAGEHDYAVLDLKEEEGHKFMLVKNPWCEGPTWRGQIVKRTERRDHEIRGSETSLLDDLEQLSSPKDLISDDEKLFPGTFWMDLNNVTQHFESIYLNWNPGLFSNRQDIHFAWPLDDQSQRSSSFANNPQFTLSIERGNVAWLLLCKHFQDAPRLQPYTTSPEQAHTEPGFISLYLYDAGGKEVLMSEGSVARVPFVDSPQTLLRLNHLKPGRLYTVVATQEELPAGNYSFTLCAFANSAISLEHAARKFARQTSVIGCWTTETSGGNAGSPLYSQNPQYSIVISSTTPLSLLLDTPDKTLPVHAKIVHGRGLRVYTVRSRDVICDSKDYRRGCALAETTNLEPGTYTIIVSTFEVDQLGDFTLRVDSSTDVRLVEIPREGAGRVKTSLSNAVFGPEWQAVAAPIAPRRLTKLMVVAKHAAEGNSRGRNPREERSAIRVSIEMGDGPTRRILVASSGGDYSDSLAGVRTEEIDIAPEMVKDQRMWLVVERMFTPLGRQEEVLSVEMFTEMRDNIVVGVWRKRDEY